jgi:hypothetical protein
MNIRRMWINQPSTSQPLHHLHGTNVLAVEDDRGAIKERPQVWIL